MPFRPAHEHEIDATYADNKRYNIWYEFRRFASRVYGRRAAWVRVTRSATPEEQCDDWADMWDVAVYNRRGHRLKPLLQTRWWKRRLKTVDFLNMPADEQAALIAQAEHSWYSNFPFLEADSSVYLVFMPPLPQGPTLYVYAPDRRQSTGWRRRVSGNTVAQRRVGMWIGRQGLKKLARKVQGERIVSHQEPGDERFFRPATVQDMGGVNEYRGARSYWLGCVQFAQELYGPTATRLNITGEWQPVQHDGDEKVYYTSVITQVTVYDQMGRQLAPDLTTAWWRDRLQHPDFQTLIAANRTASLIQIVQARYEEFRPGPEGTETVLLDSPPVQKGPTLYVYEDDTTMSPTRSFSTGDPGSA